MSAVHPRQHSSFAQLNARRTAVAKTLWAVSRRSAWPRKHPPFNSLGLALQQAAAENA